MNYGDYKEVSDLSELPQVDSGSKFFVCIGGKKDYQCFYESKKLSRGQFLEKYANKLDPAIDILYEDEDIIIRQDIQFAIPGFYVIATKQIARRINQLDFRIIEKCHYFSNKIKKLLFTDASVKSVFIGYDEHYEKPSSTHFWILPVYEEKINLSNLSIHDKEFWNYFGYSYKFQESKQKIHDLNEKLRRILHKQEKNGKF